MVGRYLGQIIGQRRVGNAEIGELNGNKGGRELNWVNLKVIVRSLLKK